MRELLHCDEILLSGEIMKCTYISLSKSYVTGFVRQIYQS